MLTMKSTRRTPRASAAQESPAVRDTTDGGAFSFLPHALAEGTGAADPPPPGDTLFPYGVAPEAVRVNTP